MLTNGDQTFLELGNPQVECESAVPDVVVLAFRRTYDSGGSTFNLRSAGFHIVIP